MRLLSSARDGIPGKNNLDGRQRVEAGKTNIAGKEEGVEGEGES